MIAARVLAVSIALAALPASAEVRLPHVIGNHMVLQREMPIRIWGWADPGERVRVILRTQSKTATADAAGSWQVELAPLEAGGPLSMTVAGGNTITLNDILIGEVWLCSGQSNMEWSVRRTKDANREIAEAKYPNVRLFHVPKHHSGQPQSDVNATWRRCDPGAVANFSAVGYFFGRHLHKELDIPIGLIASSWGGTRIEPWTPPCGFAAVEKLKGISDQLAKQRADYRKAVAGSVDGIEAWARAARKALAENGPIPGAPPFPTEGKGSHQSPTRLYNAMIHGLVPLSLRGAIWYQGESNNGEGMMYHEKMKALISGWREVFRNDRLAFYFVQLAPYRYRGNAMSLPGIWEAQAATLKVPHTGMAVTTDIGNTRDIHPRNKQDVGKRLALWALAKNYEKTDLVYSGPLYRSMTVEGGRIRVKFDHVGGGLKSRDDKELTHFEGRGRDRRRRRPGLERRGNAARRGAVRLEPARRAQSVQQGRAAGVALPDEQVRGSGPVHPPRRDEQDCPRAGYGGEARSSAR
jgi:sialate O-acetylesterase